MPFQWTAYNSNEYTFVVQYVVQQYFIQGSQNAKVEKQGLNRCSMYGKGEKKFNRTDAERLLRMLVMQDILAEDLTEGTYAQVIGYMKLGPKAMDFLKGTVKVGFLL